MTNYLLEALINKIRAFFDDYAPYTTENERDYTYYNLKQIKKELEDPELIEKLDDIFKDFQELADNNIIILPDID